MRTMGNHKQFGKHSMGFLDGHAANMAADTRHWGGQGWRSINAKWIRYPGRPVPEPYRYSSDYTARNLD